MSLPAPSAPHPAPPAQVGTVVEHESFRVSLSRPDVGGEAGAPLVLVDVDMLELDEAEALIAALQLAVSRARG